MRPGDTLSAEQVAEVQEFVFAHEYGVAVETLAGILLDDGGSIPAFAVSCIKALTERMQSDGEPFLPELQAAFDNQQVARLHR